MTLRSLLVDLVSTNDQKEVPDEQILNVLRENDRIAMGTQDIADAVDMSRQGVENRLDELELENRVQSQKIGSVLVWDLHPDERRDVVPPEIDRLVHAFDQIRDQFAMTRRLGMYILLTGFAIIFTSLSTALAATPVDPFAEMLLVWGYGIAAGGGAAWFVGGGTQLATIVTEHVVYWRLTGESLRTWKEADAAASSQRGQIDGRLIVGLFVLVLIGGALVGAASDLQAGLAASSAFSWFEATVVAGLFLVALVAMVLGIE
jgi:hypothetical protein